jgi:hypothetical protein
MKFAGLWGLAAVAALALSWAAVSQVRDRVIQPVTVIPTTIAVIAAETPDPTIVPIQPAIDPQPDPDLATSTTPADEASGSVTSTTSTTRAPSASSGTSPTTAGPQTTSTTTPSVTTTTAPPETTTTSAPSGTVSSHSTPGGSVTISSSPGQVDFVSAIPQAGFTTELRDAGPERVRVRFVGATKSFEFEAKWEDGGLEVETSEHTP